MIPQAPVAAQAQVVKSADGKNITLENGLIRRTFRLGPNAATVALDHVVTGEAFVRAVEPEARVTLNGVDYAVGGLVGQPDRAYLTDAWIATMTADPKAFRFTGYEVGAPTQRFAWKRSVGDASNAAWPPEGVSLTLHFAPPPDAPAGVSVDVHYELYRELPAVSKWITVRNDGPSAVRVDRFDAERLAAVEPESIVDPVEKWRETNLTVVTDYAFGGMGVSNSNKTVRWEIDPNYETQVNYERKTPCLLVCRPPYGPAVDLAPGKTLESFRVFELLHDSTDRERRGLETRRMWRTIAPWCLDNPLMLHVTSVDPTVVKTAIDQCAETGFEMVILSFGSGLNLEDDSPANLAKFKALADYAHDKKIRLGGYSLLASRRISDDHDCINPKTGKAGGTIFGNSPCLCSAWGIDYFAKIKHFLEATGFDLLEHDGSYPGDVCASTKHPGHRGLDDSQWRQFERIRDLYRWCRGKGIYLNVPDWYFLQGSNKTAMGYRESNWSLPRAQQHIHARQNLYDGTWEKAPSMGWMFVPLVEYQGGGAAATIEPLKTHIADYERHLQNCLGYGAQACYRGPRLYDSPEVRAMVTRWVNWFKQHRAILESDVIHVRRADGRRIDAILHVNPTLPTRAMALFYNPTDATRTETIRLPLHHAGRRDRSVRVTVPAGGMSWALFD